MTKEEYLESILRDIKTRKEAGKSRLFKIDEKISDETAHFVESYFKSRPDEYIIETRKCMTCKGTWNIGIYFKISNPN